MESTFFDEIQAVYREAWNEKVRIEQERIYHATHLTKTDLEAVERVKAMCTNLELKLKIVKAAGDLQNYYVIYKGDDLMPLIHLDYDIQHKVIDDIKQAILKHYGSGFGVSYTDQAYDGYGDSLKNSTFTLTWFTVIN